MIPTVKQASFLADDDTFEIFYGGAAGGGKSDALLMAAAQYLHVPGYSALLLRRTFTLLNQPKGLMPRAESWWRGTAARWVEDEKTWYFPVPGGGQSTIKFGHMEHERNKFDYLSAEFQFVGYDELTEFSQTQYEFLFSRMRRTTFLQSLGVPIRMRSASNPGNTGHEWVRARFVRQEPWQKDNAGYDSERDAIFESDSGIWFPRPRFIPAVLDDNPYLDRHSYLRSLAGLDPATRQQYLKGNWDVTVGGAQFLREWFDGRYLDSAPPNIVAAVRHWDTAATAPIAGQVNNADWTVGALVGVTDGEPPEYIILHLERFQGHPGTVEHRIRETTRSDWFEWVEEKGIPVLVSMEQEPGASGKIVVDSYATRVLAGYPFVPIRSSGKKEQRSIPFANLAQARMVWMRRAGWTRSLLEEMDLFPYGEHDDQIDAVSGAINQLAQGMGLTRASSSAQRMFNWR